MISGKQGKCITLAIFVLRKCLLGCPQTRQGLLDTVGLLTKQLQSHQKYDIIRWKVAMGCS